MQRLLMDKLVEWKNKKDRKPLILKGARQVGKTWLMKEFAKEYYENYAYISFYNNKTAASLFESDYDSKRIIEGIKVLTKETINPEKTLIIFDEIQNALRVLESLKYFSEEAPEYHIIVAGSLLGVALHKDISFPVGKVDELTLHPMNFKEFLLALGESELASIIDNYADSFVSDFADRYKELLKKYLVVGGMPEVVSNYVLTADYTVVREKQLSIINQYEGDFGKHIDPRQLPRIRMTWDSIPLQLAKESKKFFFGRIKKGARMSDFEIAIEWLCNAGLVHKVNLVSKPAHPLKAYVDFSSFKLFLIDVGLLGALSELNPQSVLLGNKVYEEFKGAIAEQYVLQELIAGEKYTPYYFSSEKLSFEVDFLIQREQDIIPIEVKAEDNLRAKSLKFYCEKYKPAMAIRTSTAKTRVQEWMINIPLWAISSI